MKVYRIEITYSEVISVKAESQEEAEAGIPEYLQNIGMEDFDIEVTEAKAN